MSKLFRNLILAALLVSLCGLPALASEAEEEFQTNRARLLVYILRTQLAQNHYSNKTIDDDFSRAAFSLYLKQLDGQKRFLLQSDVDRLTGYSTLIDDEINKGRIDLPTLGAQLLNYRVNLVRKLVNGIFERDFDLNRKESLQTDPEKLAYCKDEAELTDRWRKTLKYQVINRYLNLLEEEEEKVTAEGAEEKKQTPEELLRVATDKVKKRNADFFSRMLEESTQDHYDRYFNAITRAFDPHTNYLAPQSKEDFDISMSGSLEGIGATLQEEDGYIKVVRVIPGSAASRQGQLQAEDIILAVAQGDDEPVDVTDTRLRDAVSLIRGKKGTEVRLTVKKPDSTQQVIPIVRDVVQIEETFVKSTTINDPATGQAIGYIKIPSFYRDFKHSFSGDGRNSTDDVREELKKLHKAAIGGLILDLRNNGGGALTDAVAITGLFIETGPVVQVKDRNGRINTLSDRNPEIVYNGPLVVLVNKFSASASEILAGALQDYGRAVIIGGEHTYGKGTVQTMVDLNGNLPFIKMDKFRPLGALKLTTQKFYRISGESTQYRGVVPDITLPDQLRYVEAGEQYVDYSLPWDTVAKITYAPWNRPGTAVSELQSSSHQRVDRDDEFSEIKKQSEKVKERREQTLQSLSLDDLRREREETRELTKGARAMRGHGGMSGVSDLVEPSQKAADEDKDSWIAALTEDPYVHEGMAVLSDLFPVAPSKTVAGSPGDEKEPGSETPAAYSRPRF